MTLRGRAALAGAVATVGCTLAAPADVRASRPQGIDVSQFQGSIDWTTVHNPTTSGGGGKDFVFIRATRGGTTGVGSSGGTTGTGACRYDDPSFAGNIAGAHAAGMLAGPYHFARVDRYDPLDPMGLSGNLSSPEDEANHFLQIAGAYMAPGYLRPVLDLETGNSNTSKTQRTDWVTRFMNTIVAANGRGATPLIYGPSSYARDELNSSVNVCDLWLTRPNASSDSQTGDRITPTGV